MIADLDQQENRKRVWASQSAYSLNQARTQLQRQRSYDQRRARLVQDYDEAIGVDVLALRSSLVVPTDTRNAFQTTEDDNEAGPSSPPALANPVSNP